MDWMDKHASLEKSTMVEKQAFVQSSFPRVGGIGNGNGVPLSSTAPYINNSMNDLALGKDFEIPVIKPVELWNKPDIPKASTMDLIQTQAPVLGYDNTANLLNGVDNASDSRSGMISTMDVVKGFTRMGVGAAAAYGVAGAIGTMFSLPPNIKAKMSQYGAVAGGLVNSGFLPELKKLF